MEGKSFFDKLLDLLKSFWNSTYPAVVKAAKFLWKYLLILSKEFWNVIKAVSKFLYEQVLKLWNTEPHGKKIVLGGFTAIVVTLGIIAAVGGSGKASENTPTDSSDVIDSSSETNENNQSEYDPKDDPYRKYDDGLIEYDYSDMHWETTGLRTYYVKTSTGQYHGMYFSTNDGVVENGVTAITYYWDGEEVRYIDYIDYPQIESEYRYFDTWTHEYYFYYSNGNVMEYYKEEMINDNWELVEKIRYYENETIDYHIIHYSNGFTNESFDVNGMLVSETIFAYPSYEYYAYFEDGTPSHVMVGEINTSNYSYDQFVDGQYNNPYFHLYTSAIQDLYSAPGILRESNVYADMYWLLSEYDESGIIEYQKEGRYVDYNTTIMKIERYFSDGEVQSETCWEADGYNFCGE